MGKINFSKLARQPKYALPILILPFVIGFICIFAFDNDDKKVESAAEVVVDLPDAVDETEMSKSALMEQRIREEDADRRAYNDSGSPAGFHHACDTVGQPTAT